MINASKTLLTFVALMVAGQVSIVSAQKDTTRVIPLKPSQELKEILIDHGLKNEGFYQIVEYHDFKKSFAEIDQLRKSKDLLKALERVLKDQAALDKNHLAVLSVLEFNSSKAPRLDKILELFEEKRAVVISSSSASLMSADTRAKNALAVAKDLDAFENAELKDKLEQALKLAMDVLDRELSDTNNNNAASLVYYTEQVKQLTHELELKNAELGDRGCTK